MSRRDTIIIAVLVNAGLLLVLFATAWRSDRKKETNEMQIASQMPVEENLDTALLPIDGEELAFSSPTNPVGASVDSMSMPLSTEALLNQYAGETLNIDTLVSSPDGVVVEEIPMSANTIQVVPAPTAPTITLAPKEESKGENVISVTVKKGDVLERIARANGTSVAAIMKASNITSTNLKIGQVLKVPSKGKSASVAPASTSAPASSTAQEYYVVKEGDNPWLIATRNHVKLDDLLRMNGIDEQKAKKLRPGDKLRIR